MPKTTRAYVLASQTGPEALELKEIPLPELGHGDALIRVRASSLNYRDHLTTLGRYGPGHDMTGRVPLSDGAGEVVDIGAGVTDVKTGDRVAANFFPYWISGKPNAEQLKKALGGAFAPGMLAEYTVVPATCLVKLPAAFTFAEAATLPCAGVTAWYALFEAFKLQPGQTVVVQGTGGVSIFALQLAKLSGARVIATSSSDAKLERVKALGADAVINYVAKPDWDREVKRLTNGVGADIVVDVGGAGTIVKSVSAAAIRGGIPVIGVLSGLETNMSLFQVLAKQAVLSGIYVGAREHLQYTANALAAGEVKPVIDRIFSFAEAREAFAYQATNQHFGKIVIDHN